MIRTIDEIKNDDAIKNHPVIKKLEESLAGVFGDVLRLNPNETVGIVYQQLEGDPEWLNNPMEFAKYIYERLWVDAVVERVYNKRFVYARIKE